MKNLMYKVIYADIKILELKLKIITNKKECLLDSKPFWLYRKKFENWISELTKLQKEEEVILNELKAAYSDLEFFL